MDRCPNQIWGERSGLVDLVGATARRSSRWVLLAASLALGPGHAVAFDLDVERASYPRGRGPRVVFDRAHGNGHQIGPGGEYAELGELLRNDGFRVEESFTPFDSPAFVDQLDRGACLAYLRDLYGLASSPSGSPIDVLVVPTALEPVTPAEVEVLRRWVHCGGAVFHVFEHAPFLDPSRWLAQVWGANLAGTVEGGGSRIARFQPNDGTFDPTHPIALGRRAEEAIPFVANWHTAAGFGASEPRERAVPFRRLRPLMLYPAGTRILNPVTFVPFPAGPEPLLSALAVQDGLGRVHLGGEASMYTVNPPTFVGWIGMSSPSAPFNKQYALNAFRWLAGSLCEGAPDRDADGVCDPLDDCSSTANTLQRDTDRDGYGNACDADFDGDGRVDARDAARLAGALGSREGDADFDPDLDLDGDGTVGLLDVMQYVALAERAPGPSALSCAGTPPCEPPTCTSAQDRDLDGVCDGIDVCLLRLDTPQRDSDADGYGDSCDPDFDQDGLVSALDLVRLEGALGLAAGDPTFEPVLDLDGDGAVGESDLEIARASVGSAPGPSGLACAGRGRCTLPPCTGGADSDADGICDERDRCLLAWDPLQKDADLDGLGKACDCDDRDGGVYPGAPELCDGLDNDCDGLVPARELDADGDGFSECGGDCDDREALVSPDALEIPRNAVDENCDGSLLSCDRSTARTSPGRYRRCVVREIRWLCNAGLPTDGPSWDPRPPGLDDSGSTGRAKPRCRVARGTCPPRALSRSGPSVSSPRLSARAQATRLPGSSLRQSALEQPSTRCAEGETGDDEEDDDRFDARD